MSEEKNHQSEADPFASMIQMYENWTKMWSGTMSESATSKRFVETMGQQMEGSLEAMALMRQQMGSMIEKYLQQMNLPTHGEVVSLADRLTVLEMKMDDLDAKLDEALDLLKKDK